MASVKISKSKTHPQANLFSNNNPVSDFTRFELSQPLVTEREREIDRQTERVDWLVVDSLLK